MPASSCGPVKESYPLVDLEAKHCHFVNGITTINGILDEATTTVDGGFSTSTTITAVFSDNFLVRCEPNRV